MICLTRCMPKLSYCSHVCTSLSPLHLLITASLHTLIVPSGTHKPKLDMETCLQRVNKSELEKDNQKHYKCFARIAEISRTELRMREVMHKAEESKLNSRVLTLLSHTTIKRYTYLYLLFHLFSFFYPFFSI